jgi:hypothetical protein
MNEAEEEELLKIYEERDGELLVEFQGGRFPWEGRIILPVKV